VEAENLRVGIIKLVIFMKSVKVALISLFVLFSVGLNAQVFVGGSFGLRLSGGTNDDNSKKPSKFELGIAPVAGKFISEKAAVGVGLNFGSSVENNNQSIEVVDKVTAFGISPFIRYYAVNLNKFSVFGQGTVGLSFAKQNSTVEGDLVEGPKSSVMSLGIVPGLAYDVNDKISLETTINFFNFGFSHSVTKSANGSDKEKTTAFGMGADLDNIANTNNISIGAIFKF
jgi:opacity protein-like surface antigen